MEPAAIGQAIVDLLDGYLRDPALITAAEDEFHELVPQGLQDDIDAVLKYATAKTNKNYPPLLLIQLCYAYLLPGTVDVTHRHPNARGSLVSGRLGQFLLDRHIPCAGPDCMQTLAKNATNLVRGNIAGFDSALTWASTVATKEQVRAAASYTAARIAATSRPVQKLPKLRRGELTFARLSMLFDDMFNTASEGAHEQFIIAALLYSLVHAYQSGYRVETKHLTVSDASSKVAGDIQIMVGPKAIEAYEVTANDWAEKIGKAGKTIRDHDLARLNIVANVTPGQHADMLKTIAQLGHDVSVVEVRPFAAALLAALDKGQRETALGRLYEFLDRYQPHVSRVNSYVELLRSHKLTVDAEQAEGTPED